MAKIRSVYKYRLEFGSDDHASILLPADAQILDVRGGPMNAWLWALVNPAAKTVERTFRIAGTGQKLSGSLRHIKTEHYQYPPSSNVLYDSPLVWHFFEVIDE
jgi:hypothetical protein